jgi:hypothetical protein
MTTVVTRGAASAQALGYASSSAAVNYIEDVFSTYLYTGTGAGVELQINNGIDVSTKGGLVWCKNRSASQQHWLFDTARGMTYAVARSLNSASTAAQASQGTNFIKADTTGFTLGTDAGSTSPKISGDTYASWTFREQPKFFDVVTYTGNGAGAGQTINHNLGSIPGFIICKSTSTTGDWAVCARTGGASSPASSITYATGLSLNSTGAALYSGTLGDFPTATTFSTAGIIDNPGNYPNVNGVTYVAYLFAHNAGGFGLTGTDNVISCGSFTTDGSGNATVDLGYEPQWFLRKQSSGVNDWVIFDNMRGWSLSDDAFLYPNSSSAEASANRGNPTATGFTLTNQSASADFIYIAIRRGPMKVPTDATKVFSPLAYTGTGGTRTLTSNFAPDVSISSDRSATYGMGAFLDKLRGISAQVQSWTSNGEPSYSATSSTEITAYTNTGVTLGSSTGGAINASGITYVDYLLQRAPGFMDEVCYTGTSVARTVTHNLAAVPELMIVKLRDQAASWRVYASPLTATSYLGLNQSTGSTSASDVWNNTAPTASVFTVGTSANVNGAYVYVAYLFATCPGVSKVGSYTGNGTTQTIDCGFGAGGVRFVLIKRTDTTGDWYIYDTARGMTTLTDPYLRLNSISPEVATLGSVTTVSTGFALNSAILAAINANGGTYIFLAIA